MAPTWIENDVNTNKDISAAVSVGVYTSTGDKFVMPQLLADQVAGGGDYVYYVTLQVGGAGSAYVIGPKTTHTAAASETAIGAQGGFIAVRSGDVLTVYIDGLAGDVATPDVTVRWFELDASANVTYSAGVAVSGRLAEYADLPSEPLDATGVRTAVGLASANLDTQLAGLPTDADVQTAATSALTAYDPPTKAEMDAATALLATAAALAVVDANVDASLADTSELQTDWADGGRLDLLLDAAAVSTGLDAAGVRAAVGLAAADLDTQLGDIQSTVDQLDDIFIYTLTTDGTTPIRDALVQVFSDAGMTVIVDYGITDYYGKVRLHLKEPGTYYLHRTKVGASFVNPDMETIP